MNERFKRLAEQAFFDETTSLPSVQTYTFSDHKIQRFAELIMQEVFSVIDSEQERYCNLTNGSGSDYNDFIDCLENLKLELEDGFLKDG